MINQYLNSKNEEVQRLAESRIKDIPWKKWGPYLSERQWGTVREDYSVNGNAWDYFTHDQARSRAYHWGEDGLAGYSDDKQRLCFALALWNGADPILKERLFGLSNSESNHGEDVKEYYFYLDSTPTHSYMKYLYKYPQATYPYEQLVRTNRQRSRSEFEYELLDTGVFDQDRYFDIFVEYAKEAPDDTMVQITVHNRGPEPAALSLLPTLWFRNTWSWTKNAPKPELKETKALKGAKVVAASHLELGEYYLYCEGDGQLLFTENETNYQRIFGTPNQTPYVKDSIHNYIIHGEKEAVNPAKTGTKVSIHYNLTIGAGENQVIRLRLNNVPPANLKTTYPDGDTFGDHFEGVFSNRLREADEFFAAITPDSIEGTDQALVMRQALAGLLWTKQYYYFDLDLWLKEHGAHPMINGRSMRIQRNNNWFHMVNNEVISMPDKWEYPWYAAWDLAFHCITLAMVDIAFAKQQLDLMLRDVYLHPSGQIPAYEWNFGDVNPPVHAWATMFVYNIEQELLGKGDVQWLKGCFQKLLMNFTWWVNRKDPSGRNVFEGGFLGLDNIGVFDRSSPLPTGGNLEQADGTAWMALFSQTMLQIALELSLTDSSYEDMALKFVEHFFSIAGAMDRIGDLQDEMWDEADGFFYDLLRLPDGQGMRLKVRSMVGLLPLCAATVIENEHMGKFPSIGARAQKYVDRNPELIKNLASPFKIGYGGRRLLAVMDETKLRRVLDKMLDEKEFLSPYGIRALSRYHAEHPFVFNVNGEEYRVEYLPAESNTGMFGGNSNWRGPVWMPVNLLIIRSLLNYYSFYGDDFKVECPTGSGKQMTLYDVSQEIANRLTGIFVRNESGQRPVFGGNWKFQNDPYWRDHILFYEYFHGDNGAGLGASHQTGWTAGVARLIQYFSARSRDQIARGKASEKVGRTSKPMRRMPDAMTNLPDHPVLYEINTWVWLNELSRQAGHPVTLDNVPPETWDALSDWGFDAVWLMGVWERSPAGIRIAMQNEGLVAEFHRALPDFTPEDVAGSPYCIRRYSVDERLGGPIGLAAARQALSERGMGLVLDFVPNHVAPDHLWVTEHPEYFVLGDAGDLALSPADFIQAGKSVIARGRDPYFAPWPDVVQLNAFDPGLRKAITATLTEIASQCDGVRCDMAMLFLNNIFAQTWGNRAGAQPAAEYWTAVIGAVKAAYPGFLFMAEAYWDKEWELQQLGFDYCYDKRLYDRLAHENAQAVRGHLQASLDYQTRLVRFIENHDEPRAAATFSPEKQRAAALTVSTQMGVRLFHEGQFEGRKVKLPVFLARRPDEPVDAALQEFYRQLLAGLRTDTLHAGEWRLCDCSGWLDNMSFQNLVAWSWRKPGAFALVVVNLSSNPAQAQVRLPWGELAGRLWQLTDRLTGKSFERGGNEMLDPGLFVDLPPWGTHFFTI